MGIGYRWGCTSKGVQRCFSAGRGGYCVGKGGFQRTSVGIL